jgi:tape measure domain-containing protein
VGVVANVGINLDSKGAISGVQSLDKAVTGLVAKFASVTAVVATVTKSLNVAFERGAAEQKLKNFTKSTEEYEAALAVAARSADKFGMSQTETTKALADTYSRLQGLGFGLKETSEIYDGFNAIAKASGTTAEDASGAFLQLSQALGSGTLQGDELRSILERMPNLAQAIATSMGRSASEIREMGKSGELTSEVIYKALKEAADASGDFGDKLNDQQKSQQALNKATDKLFNSIGKLFAPIVISGAKSLAGVFDVLSTTVSNLEGPMAVINQALLFITGNAKVLVQIVGGIAATVGVFKAIGIATQVWAKATAVLAAAKRGAAAAAAVLQGIINPASLATTAAAVAAGAAVYLGLGAAIDGATAQALELNNEQAKTQGEALKTLNNFSSMPEKVNAVTEAQKRQVESLKSAVEQTDKQKASIEAQAAAFENMLSVNEARLSAEREINNLQGQILNRAYEQATTAQQRLQIAKQIFQNTVRGAQIEYQQALASIQAEEQRLQLKLKGAEAEYNTIAARGQLAILEAKSVEEETKKRAQLEAALASQQAAAQVIADQISAQQQIGQYQQQAAEAQLQSKVLAAQTALEQKLISDKIGLSQVEATRLSGQLAQGATSTNQLASGTGRVASNAQQSAVMFIQVANNAASAAAAINNAAAAQERLNAARSRQGGGGGGGAEQAAKGAYWQGGFKAFAKGGVVTGPTLGLIGEGGESEYIIPQSKAAGFAMNYLGGKRGAGAIPGFAEGGYVASSANVNIQTGPVTQMNGTNYVTTQEMGKAVQAGVQQTLDVIRRDNYVRMQLGLA